MLGLPQRGLRRTTRPPRALQHQGQAPGGKTRQLPGVLVNQPVDVERLDRLERLHRSVHIRYVDGE
jgi:hypothetical protein